MAGSSITFVHYTAGPIKKIVATLTGDDTDGSFPATALPKFSGKLLTLETNPGATEPTDDYDLTLVDGDGLDRLQGVGVDRDTTTSEEVAIVFSGKELRAYVAMQDTLTLTPANNSVNDAIIVITIYYEGRAVS